MRRIIDTRMIARLGQKFIIFAQLRVAMALPQGTHRSYLATRPTIHSPRFFVEENV
jgi:hypothetical protein